MKKTILLLLLIVSFQGFTQLELDKRKSLFCHAREGLSLRIAPNVTAEKDTIISYMDEVKLISIQDSIFSIKGFSGSWYQVDYQGHKGFVFSAYLSTIKIKVKTGKHIYLKDFAFENWNQTDGDKNFEMSDDQNKRIEAQFGANRYDCAPGGYCDLDENLYLTGKNVQELFILFASYLIDYNEYNFDRKKFSYEKEDEAYKYNYYKEVKNGFDLEIFQTYRLNKDNSYKSISMGFDWEGGGGTLTVSKWTENMLRVSQTYYCH
ncbi:MAG: SH3 domain-containing protein [Crocinitomicaceae bacterium]